MKKAAFVACMAVLATGQWAGAAVATYSDESAFLAANPIVSVETFDSYPPTAFGSVTTIDGVRYETEQGGLPWPAQWAIGHGMGSPGYVTPPHTLGSTHITSDTMSFGTGQYVHAFGFWFMSGGLNYRAHWEILVEETDGGTELLDFSSFNICRYFGFASDVGIKQVIARDYPGDGGGYNWSYDNIAHSEVLVEPGTLGLLLSGGLGLLRRKK